MELPIVKPSEELAYLVGVMQGDGCLYKYKDGKKKKQYTRIVLMLGAKDIEMVKTARDIFAKLFEREIRICKKSTGIFDFHASVKTLLPTFKELDIDFKDPPKPPVWSKVDVKFFGPYLAGLIIDADGTVAITRPKYPQCRIRITSGHQQIELEKVVESILGCCVAVYKIKKFSKKWGVWGSGFDLDFVLSSKIILKFTKYVLPHIQIPRKRERIIKYLELISN